jgi:signal transduction histidine kinase
MIDLTRRKRQKITISEIDLKKSISKSVQELSDLNSAYKLQISTSVDADYPFFNDAGQVEIIFSNLISNAIKHQHAYELNPVLNINITVNSKKAVMMFKDNGVGIPSEELSKVFDMFYRGQTTKSEGSGLGLYIIKEVVKKLKGKIYVDSEVGEGSQFVIELPNKIDPDFLRKLNKIKNDAA